MPAAAAASWKRRLSCRVVRCCPCRRPGNNQRSPTGTPASKRFGRTFHHCRSNTSNSGGSMTWRSIDALLFVVDADGRAVDETTFSKDFRVALDAAGLAHLHFHGLRHTAGAALAEAGCSEKEIAAVLGHKTLSMVQKYTQGARRKRLASSAIAKLEGRGTGTERESGKLDA